MQLVQSREQILKNVIKLDSYLHSTNQNERFFAKNLIRNGTCFVVFRQGQRSIFAPSRFIGYADNTMFAHENNLEKDGRKTNKAIESAVHSSPMIDGPLEQSYQRFCQTEGIEYRPRAPFNKPHKYWNNL